MDYSIAKSNQDEVSFEYLAVYLSKLKHIGKNKILPKEAFSSAVEKRTSENYNVSHVAALLHEYDVFFNLELHYPELLKVRDSKGYTPYRYLLSSWCYDVSVNNQYEVAKYLPSLNQRFDFTSDSHFTDDKVLHKFLLLCGDSYVIRYARENGIINIDSLQLVQDLMDLELRDTLADAGFDADLPSHDAIALAEELDKKSFDFDSVVEKLTTICDAFGDADLFHYSEDYNAISSRIQDLVKKLEAQTDSTFKIQILELYEQYFSDDAFILSSNI